MGAKPILKGGKALFCYVNFLVNSSVGGETMQSSSFKLSCAPADTCLVTCLPLLLLANDRGAIAAGFNRPEIGP